jgi:hypothetical protein
VLGPVAKAVASDPSDAYLQAVLASVYYHHWRLYPTRHPELGLRTVASAVIAQAVDEHGPAGWEAEVRLRLLFAQHLLDEEMKKEQVQLAFLALAKLVDNDPKEPRLRYRLAEFLYRLGKPGEGKDQARIARELDAEATDPKRKLTPDQREMVRQWTAAK